ncbi:MAG TPA: hypothetical protein VN249_07670 [Prolixibacteraceae bacterium]|nr:hypothetical protein [Prolixibacteraceae bacterium]
MRTSYLLMILCFISASCFSQNRNTEISHYILPEFREGIVSMKAGGKNVTMLNYNSLTEEMIFDTNGKKLAIDKLDDIDAIYIDERKFIPLQNKFVEILYQNKYEVYAAHKCSWVDPGKPAAYGGTSQTSATTSYTSIIGGGQVYELALPEGITTKPYTEYWLRKDGKLSLFINIRQLSKQFDDKSDIFKKYVKEHKVTYENQDSLIELIKYMEQQ